MAALRWTAGATALLTYVLIVLGALVRATNSGLSCPDWPTCYGYWVPLPSHEPLYAAAGYTYVQVMLEWVHRLIAGVFVGPLALVLAALAWRVRHERPMVMRGAIALVALLLVQGALGGITVLDANSPWSVALHLGNALLVLTAMLFIFERTGRAITTAIPATPGAPGPIDGRVATLAATGWLLALLTMVSAAMTAKSGASLACSGWPLCNGELVPALDDPLVAMNFTHRLLALALSATILFLFVLVRDGSAGRTLRNLAAAALGLVTLEVLLGGLVVVLYIPTTLAVAHQALAVLIFASLTLAMWRSLPAAAASRSHHHPGDGHAVALRGA